MRARPARLLHEALQMKQAHGLDVAGYEEENAYEGKNDSVLSIHGFPLLPDEEAGIAYPASTSIELFSSRYLGFLRLFLTLFIHCWVWANIGPRMGRTLPRHV